MSDDAKKAYDVWLKNNPEATDEDKANVKILYGLSDEVPAPAPAPLAKKD